MAWKTTDLLLLQLRAEDPDAWDRLVGHFHGAVVRIARQLGLPEEEAEDVTQETFLTVMEHLREGRYVPSRGRLRSWLYAVARRQAMQVRRDGAVRRRLEAFSAEEAGPLPTSRLPQEDFHHRAVLALCMRRLRQTAPDRMVKVFEATVLHGRSAADVGRELGMTANAVCVTKHRALRRIRRLLQKLDFEAP